MLEWLDATFDGSMHTLWTHGQDRHPEKAMIDVAHMLPMPCNVALPPPASRSLQVGTAPPLLRAAALSSAPGTAGLHFVNRTLSQKAESHR